MTKRLPKSFNCPTEFTLSVLGGKWKTIILCYLALQPFRYSELRRLLPSLSDKMLAERLHELKLKGLVFQKKISQTGTSTYCLTDKGRSLTDLLHQIYDWGYLHAKDFDVKVGEPLKEMANETTTVSTRRNQVAVDSRVQTQV